MEWLVLMMVVVPLLTLGAGGAWWLSEQARRNRLLGGDPEVARLAARAEAAVDRLTSGPAVTGLPPSLADDVRQRTSELVRTVLPELIERRRVLVERRARSDVKALEGEISRFERERAAATDPETVRLLETNLDLARERLSGALALQDELRRIDLAIQALVSNVEALEERYSGAGTNLPGAQKLEGATRLLDELKGVQEELRKLEGSTLALPDAPPESAERNRRKVR